MWVIECIGEALPVILLVAVAYVMSRGDEQ